VKEEELLAQVTVPQVGGQNVGATRPRSRKDCPKEARQSQARFKAEKNAVNNFS
jgi:hypothetical protein